MKLIRCEFFRPTGPALAVLGGVLLLAACAGQPEYYAMPAGDGDSASGSMKVTSRDAAKPGALTLDAKTPIVANDGNAVRPADIDAQKLQAKFAKALGAQPLPPTHYTLYFVEGGDTLTPDSQNAIISILEEIKKRPAPDLVVIGHTDRVGSVANNDRLAATRANTIRQQLITRGIDAESIQASGRGEREPLVPTADEVAEPRNRRVEILVR